MGRAKKLNEEQVRKAKADMDAENLSIKDVAARNEVSYLTMYNSLKALDLIVVKKREKKA
jgi:transposase